MQILEDHSKLHDNNPPIASIHFNIALERKSALSDYDWIKDQIQQLILERASKVMSPDEKSPGKLLQDFRRCPITGVPIDGTLNHKEAIALGLITPEERQIMRAKNKVLSENSHHDYNRYFCTTKYKRKIKDFPNQHKLITITL